MEIDDSIRKSEFIKHQLLEEFEDRGKQINRPVISDNRLVTRFRDGGNVVVTPLKRK